MPRRTTNGRGTQPAGGASRRQRGARGGPDQPAGGRPGDATRAAHERCRRARRDVERAALDLIRRRGREILGTARRYSSDLDDADDAYQRGLEILLTKAPTTREEELVRWVKTVVKHEAFALRRQRQRHAPATDDGQLGERLTPPEITHDQAERYERLSQGAEALRLLKPQETRGLRLRAEGYSYKEICRITGWTDTKVNRVLTEGRRALRRNALAIEAGGECERVAPLLDRVAVRAGGVDELRELHHHVRTCLSCRARLRSLRVTGSGLAAGRGPPPHRGRAAGFELRDESPPAGGRSGGRRGLQRSCDRTPT
jgi:RNA polymerase sigma factor (sigma-70 family)